MTNKTFEDFNQFDRKPPIGIGCKKQK